MQCPLKIECCTQSLMLKSVDGDHVVSVILKILNSLSGCYYINFSYSKFYAPHPINSVVTIWKVLKCVKWGILIKI